MVVTLAPESRPFCLRCPDVGLCRLPESSDEISFFECPTCRRQYAKKKSASLTYRWLHPISLPLYCVLFSANATAEAPRVARSLANQSSATQLTSIVHEIELELQQPTQQVREILDNPQSEETCRQFLTAIASLLREQLAKS